MSSDTIIRAKTLEELRAAGAPAVFTTDTDEWKNKLRTWWETDPEGPQRPLYPAQPEMLLIDMLAYAFSLLGREGQTAAEQRWLAFATGAHADLAASNNSTYRLLATPATCQLEFSLDTARTAPTVIASGTRALTSNNIVFTTDEELVIPAGDLSVAGSATCLTAGTSGNGHLVGAITALDASADIGLKVSNITATQGGADEETTEALTGRAARAHNRISKAGPLGSYVEQARQFSPAIIAVQATRPEPGDIALWLLLNDGAPTQAYCDQVRDFLPYETKRPQGDDLFVYPAEAVTLSVAGTAKVSGSAAEAKPLIDAVVAAAATQYSTALGGYVATAPLEYAAKQVPGLIDIELMISGLADRQLGETEFAVVTAVNITVEGDANG